MKKLLISLFFLFFYCQNFERRWQNPALATKNDRRLVWHNIPIAFCPKDMPFSLERMTDKVLIESISQDCVALTLIEISEKTPHLTHIFVLSKQNYQWQGKSPAKIFDTGWGKKWEFTDGELKIEVFLSWSTLELYFKDLFY